MVVRRHNSLQISETENRELGDGIETPCAVESYEKSRKQKLRLTELNIETDYQNILPRNKLSNCKKNQFRELENAAMGFPKNNIQFSHIRV